MAANRRGLALAVTGLIDAHVHLWVRATDPQPWIDPETMPSIDRDFTVPDLVEALAAEGASKAIVVQSSNSIDETRRLLASDSASIAGVVGWVDMTGDVSAAVKGIAAEATSPLVGVRHLVHIDPDPTWLLRPEVGAGLDALGSHDLTFDLVVRWWQLPQATSVARAHPQTRFALDHLGGPPFGSHHLAEWVALLERLAREPNVTAKVSGLPSAIGNDTWTTDDVRETFDAALNAFGPSRLMFGSDWPLVHLGGGPDRWRAAFDELVSSLTESERRSIQHDCVIDTYRLGANS